MKHTKFIPPFKQHLLFLLSVVGRRICKEGDHLFAYRCRSLAIPCSIKRHRCWSRGHREAHKRVKGLGNLRAKPIEYAKVQILKKAKKFTGTSVGNACGTRYSGTSPQAKISRVGETRQNYLNLLKPPPCFL